MALRYVRTPITSCRATKIVSGVLSLALLMGGLAACAPDTVRIQRHSQFSPDSVKRIALLPLAVLPGSRGVYKSVGEGPGPIPGPQEIRQSFDSTSGPFPLRSHSTTIAVPDFAPDLITKMVYANLLSRSGLQTTAPEISVRSVPQNMPVFELINSRSEIQRLGQALGVDAILYGIVRVYREREGTKLAAIPAAVGFELYLVDGKTGVVLWKGDFFEEQKPLTEDVLGFFSRGGTFVTAEELARSGVHRVMERFPVGES